MDKGIRQRARHLFVELNELRRRGHFGPDKRGNCVFRKTVGAQLIEEFGITPAASVAAYQDAFKFVKELNSELVDGLGRPPEKNNGGRKKKQPVSLTAKEVTAPVSTLISQGIRPHTATQKVTINPIVEAPVEPEEQVLFAVKKKSTGEVIAEGLSFEGARAMVEKAKAAKKAALYWI